MSENKTVATEEEAGIELQVPEVNTLWAGSTGYPVRIVQVTESAGETFVQVGDGYGSVFSLAQFHENFQPCTIIATAPPDTAPITIATIDDIVEQYREALTTEATARMALADARAACAVEEAAATQQAHENGAITGSNAEARKADVIVMLAKDGGVSEHREQVNLLEAVFLQAEIARKALDARIGLVKAWLYSRGGAQ